MRHEKVWAGVALGAAGLALLAVAFPYTRLPFAGEHGYLSYGGWRLASGEVPYRDFGCHDAAGVFFVHYAAHEIFGYTMPALRWFDLIWFSAILALLHSVGDRLFGRLAAALGVLFAVSAYFTLGYQATAQRDGFALLFALIALRAHLEQGARPRRDLAIDLAIGACFGLVFWLKPPLALIGGLFAARPLFDGLRGRARVVLTRWTGLALGFLLVMLVALAYLASQGALVHAHECLVLYNLEYAQVRYPLSVQLTALARTFLGSPVLLGGLVAALMALREPRWRFFAVFTLSFLPLVLLQGKLLGYHLVPLRLLLCAWCGFLVWRILPGAAGPQGFPRRARQLAAVLLVAAALATAGARRPVATYVDIWKRWATSASVRVEREELAIARFLRERTTASDSILVWGISGPGIIHFASLRPSPTRFVVVYAFTRRGPKSDLVRRWKDEYIQRLRERPPAYVVVISNDEFEAIQNVDSALALRRFVRLRQFVERSYRPVWTYEGRFKYTVLERVPEERVRDPAESGTG